MQLPVTGHPLHTRSLSMNLSLAEGGRWRAKGDVLDLRKTGFAAMPTHLQPAGIIHHMKLDLLIHPATLKIESLEATLPVMAVEPSERSGGECCVDPVGNLKALEGERLEAGFSKKLSLAFGGALGCSHLLALFHFMAAAVPQALELERDATRAKGVKRAIGECLFQRSFSLDGFQTANQDIELAVQLGDYHMRPEMAVRSSVDRLESEHDIRLYVRVQTKDLVVVELRAAERERDGDSIASAQWRERPEWADGLIDVPIIPGFAGRSIQSCGQAPERRLLLAALLQLAPGHLQVMAALADQWAVRSTQKAEGETSSAWGGMTANCYMWRADGPLRQERERR